MRRERNSLNKRIKSNVAGAAAAVVFLVVILNLPEVSRLAAQGILLFAEMVLPPLFVSTVMCSIADRLGGFQLLFPLTVPLSKAASFSRRGAEIFLLSQIGGFASAPAAISRAAENGEIRMDEARRLACVCPGGGPAFIIGAVGSKMLGSSRAGLYLFAACFFANVLLAVLTRGNGFLKKRRTANKSAVSQNLRSKSKMNLENKPKQDFASALVESVKTTSQSCLTLCGFITFFTAVTGTFAESNIFAFVSELLCFPVEKAKILLTGIAEVTGGCAAAAGFSMPGAVAAAAFFLAFTGICVQMQLISSLGKSTPGFVPLFLSRLFCGVIAAFSAVLFTSLDKTAIDVFKVTGSYAPSAATVPAGIFLLAVCCAALTGKNSGGLPQKTEESEKT